MKVLSKLVMLLLPVFALSQQVVEVSEDFVSVIIFPSTVDESIIGNEQEYLIKPSSNTSELSLRTLRITYLKVKNVEKNTNLTVFTKDGNTYEFLLNYVKKPSKLTHIIKGKELNVSDVNTTGTKTKETEVISPPVSYYSDDIKTKEVVSTPTIIKDDYAINKLAYIKKKCEQTQFIKKKIFRSFTESDNVKLTLKKVSHDRDELYFHFVLQNKGGQPYDVDFINYELIPIYDGGNTDSKILIKPLLVWEKPVRVEGKNKNHFVVVFEKFTINDNKNLEINLAEKEGERDLLLRISNKLINNPYKL